MFHPRGEWGCGVRMLDEDGDKPGTLYGSNLYRTIIGVQSSSCNAIVSPSSHPLLLLLYLQRTNLIKCMLSIPWRFLHSYLPRHSWLLCTLDASCMSTCLPGWIIFLRWWVPPRPPCNNKEKTGPTHIHIHQVNCINVLRGAVGLLLQKFNLLRNSHPHPRCVSVLPFLILIPLIFLTCLLFFNFFFSGCPCICFCCCWW